MTGALDLDLISDLPQSIIEIILTLLPIRDAVRTSILSTKWRYKWAAIPQLVIDDKCVNHLFDSSLMEISIVKFVTHLLLLHKGPIHKFQLSTKFLQSCPVVDQWLLLLSRNDIRELVLELGEGEWFRIPSCIFHCKKLTRIDLFQCELDPPLSFKGFLCLRSLSLYQVLVAPNVIESLISSCPLLESLEISYVDSLVLTIRAPNLKYLCLEGEFKDIYLENTPLLISASVSMYMTDEIAEHFEQSSSCNFVRFLGGVPRLQKLIGHIYFAKYLSVGNDLGNIQITYSHLKIIELYQVSFEDVQEVSAVFCLILNSPNLQDLRISGSSNTLLPAEERDLEFWEEKYPSNCILRKLRTINMADVSGGLHEMELIRFLLAHSPLLETLCIRPYAYIGDGRVRMLIELLGFRRASSKAEVFFIQD